jgi:hypothetical protein
MESFMFYKNIRFILIAFLTFFLVSCGGGGDGTSDSSRDVTSISGLAGVWDYSEGTDDVYYIYIDQSGNLSEYDYQGDTVDNGADCYLANINATTISHVSGNTFLSSSTGMQFTAVIDSNGALVTNDADGKITFPATTLTLSDISSILCTAARSEQKIIFGAH